MKKSPNYSSKIPLQKILNLNFKQQVIRVIDRKGKKLVKGTIGHNSFFFKKPIIEGNFYLEMIGHYPQKLTKPYKDPPCFRVGVAPTEYYYNYPLGQQFSVGYKMNGSVIQQKKEIAKLQPYKFGDVIGIGISIKQIYKNRDKRKRNYQNYIQFFINGKREGEKLFVLTEDLFSFSGSVFNQSELQVNFEKEGIKYLPEGYAAYAEHLKERCQYKDQELESYENQIMSILQRE